jgi:hypothetical protein
LKSAKFHLAQLNIGKMRAPLEDPIMAGFVEQLDYINSAADRAPGFVWRLQTEEGDATALRPFGDDLILVNMSVWTSIEVFHDYVYRSDHAESLRDRKQWFTRMEGPSVVMWWVPEGHIPDVEEGKSRLQHLEKHGPTPQAFTFKKWFPPPGASDPDAVRFDYTGCDSELG